MYFTEFVGGCGFIDGLERGKTGRSRKHKEMLWDRGLFVSEMKGRNAFDCSL